MLLSEQKKQKQNWPLGWKKNGISAHVRPMAILFKNWELYFVWDPFPSLSHCGQELDISIYMKSVGGIAYLNCYVILITH